MNSRLSNPTTKQTQSGSKLNIHRRHVQFDYQDIQNIEFFKDNAVLSAFWVGLSSIFPLGETEFIKSVNHYKDQISDPKLIAEVADFTAQEAHHAFQHKKINQHFDKQGFSTAKIEAATKRKLEEREQKWTPQKRLMRTVAAEHVTAVMAHYALSEPTALRSVPDSLRNLFLWHAIEEIEHKSVAFDVYRHCVGDMRALKRHYAAFLFFEFPMNLLMITRFLLKDLKHQSSWSERKGTLTYLFGKHGMFSSVRHLYMMFFRAGFHPWQHDDSQLVKRWKSELRPFFLNTHNAG